MVTAVGLDRDSSWEALVAGTNGHVRAFLGKGEGDLTTDSPAAAGD